MGGLLASIPLPPAVGDVGTMGKWNWLLLPATIDIPLCGTPPPVATQAPPPSPEQYDPTPPLSERRGALYNVPRGAPIVPLLPLAAVQAVPLKGP